MSERHVIKTKQIMVSKEQALAGSSTPMPLENTHFVHGRAIKEPFLTEQPVQQVLLGMGCFWGAERRFWTIPGVYTTAVGYAGGFTVNPTYEQVCTGQTGHTEVVLVVFEPSKIGLSDLLKVFFEEHNPTQGMRQGNDLGTQYRSAIYVESEQHLRTANQIAKQYQDQLSAAGLPEITTEIEMAPTFYYAEQYHQQYLAKNPNGYCGLKGTGVSCYYHAE